VKRARALLTGLLSAATRAATGLLASTARAAVSLSGIASAVCAVVGVRELAGPGWAWLTAAAYLLAAAWAAR